MIIRSSVAGRAVSRVVLAAIAILAPALPLAAQATAPAAPAPAAQAPAAALPSARSIIDRHIAAVGGKAALTKHSSMRLTGTISMPANGISGPLEVFAARPNKTLTKVTLGGFGDVLDGFDGKVGWTINPMTGPMLAQGNELAQKAFDAEFNSELRDPSRYESITTVAETSFDGRQTYKVSLKRKGGGEDIEYFDVKTGLKAGGEITRDSPNGPLTLTQVTSDYKQFGHLLQPSTLKQTTMGIEQIITVTSIEYDKVDPAVFELPAAIKALVK
jgi:hypothetical protein